MPRDAQWIPVGSYSVMGNSRKGNGDHPESEDVRWCGGWFGGSWVCICFSPSWGVLSRAWAPCDAAARPIAGVTVPFWARSGGCFPGDITRVARFDASRPGLSSKAPLGETRVGVDTAIDQSWRLQDQQSDGLDLIGGVACGHVLVTMNWSSMSKEKLPSGALVVGHIKFHNVATPAPK